MGLDGVELRSFVKDMSQFRCFVTLLIMISQEVIYSVMFVGYRRLDELPQRVGSDCRLPL